MTPLAALPLAFAAGVLTILSPCVLPLAPIVVAGGRRHGIAGSLALVAGLALTFGVVGGALASFGVEFGDSSLLRAASALILLAVGSALLVSAIGDEFERRLAPAGRAADALRARLPQAGLLGEAATGSVLAFAWAPCAGPTLGAAFALAAESHSPAAAMATMGTYALGAAGALLAIGYGLGRLASRSRWIASTAGSAGRASLSACCWRSSASPSSPVSTTASNPRSSRRCRTGSPVWPRRYDCGRRAREGFAANAP